MPRKTLRKRGKQEARYYPNLANEFSHKDLYNSDIIVEQFWDTWKEHQDGFRAGFSEKFHRSHKRDGKWLKKQAIRKAVRLKRDHGISPVVGLPKNPPKFYIHPKPGRIKS